ncbi:PREDICTED: nuclear transcription factor Y subunit B-10 isoform X1 [Brassica oleracea var. oleracea]|uniref:nuclear transcription factor Y subunit B-10 isoform X1 n=1 Tax=Brassica oleracea var. oleracea TaxID=109376 RepID=UPI0006A6A9AA|nr:PREDICTED: nuclear transcription factor Y subunit B-10 isoform X1 [Brassica oleracea var. oleracea]
MADSQAKSSGMSPGVGGGGSHESGGDQSPRSMNVREQDRFLPIANISRIMKRGLPANGKIAKDAKETMQECVSEFISFVTSEASDKCQREKRKTINGDDLLWAMTTLGFEEYVEPLKFYLTRYREMEGDNKGSGKGGESSVSAAGWSARLFLTRSLWKLSRFAYDGSNAERRVVVEQYSSQSTEIHLFMFLFPRI